MGNGNKKRFLGLYIFYWFFTIPPPSRCCSYSPLAAVSECLLLPMNAGSSAANQGQKRPAYDFKWTALLFFLEFGKSSFRKNKFFFLKKNEDLFELLVILTRVIVLLKLLVEQYVLFSTFAYKFSFPPLLTIHVPTSLSSLHFLCSLKITLFSLLNNNDGYIIDTLVFYAFLLN